MKKNVYILFAIIAMALIACNKEQSSLQEAEQEVIEEVEAISAPDKLIFGVSMDLGESVVPASKDTKASLSTLDICWSGGEKIFIANNINDDIEDCTLTKDPTYPTKGTIAVTPVEGASTYYAIYTSGTSHSDGKVVFDHTTATFSGSEVICRQSEFTASTTHRTDLAMAGKTTGDNLIMKPCLSLIKFRVHANSVAAEYVDGSGYSSVRGFNLILRHSGSRTYNCGTYSVNLSGSSMVVAGAGDGKKDYKQISSGSRLSSGTDYYFSVIPVGSIERIELQFLGFKWDDGSSSYKNTWGSDPKDYQMALEQSLSIDAGDYFNFGTLNPVDLQKAADSFTPSIDIDGDFSDWDGISDLPNTRSGGDTNYKIVNWRMTSDARNVHIYLKLYNSGLTADSYVYIGFDTADGGSSHGGLAGLESYVVVYTCKTGTDPIEFVQGADTRSTVNGSSDGTLQSWGEYGTGANAEYSFVEITIPRSKVGLSSAGTIKVAVAYDYYDTIFQELTLS